MGNNGSQQTVTAKRFGRPGHWLAVLVVAVAVGLIVRSRGEIAAWIGRRRSRGHP